MKSYCMLIFTLFFLLSNQITQAKSVYTLDVYRTNQLTKEWLLKKYKKDFNFIANAMLARDGMSSKNNQLIFFKKMDNLTKKIKK